MSKLLFNMSCTWMSIFLMMGIIGLSQGHPLISSKTYAKQAEASKWRPFGSFNNHGSKNRILPIAYATMNEPDLPMHPTVVHEYQYVSFDFSLI